MAVALEVRGRKETSTRGQYLMEAFQVRTRDPAVPVAGRPRESAMVARRQNALSPDEAAATAARTKQLRNRVQVGRERLQGGIGSGKNPPLGKISESILIWACAQRTMAHDIIPRMLQY